MFRKSKPTFRPSDGRTVYPQRIVSQGSKRIFERLPPKVLSCKEFDLERQLEAGIPLKEVNCKLLGDGVNDSSDAQKVFDAIPAENSDVQLDNE